MEEKKWQLKVGTVYSGIVCGTCCALTAILIIFLGIWKTMFVIVAFGIGWFFGRYDKKGDALRQIINRVLPPKNE